VYPPSFFPIHHPDSRYWVQKIEKPLATLISGLTLPPNLVTTILDTDVSEPWIPAMADFERRLEALKGRQRVRAARDLGEVAEGLRIVVGPKFSSGADASVTQLKMDRHCRQPRSCALFSSLSCNPFVQV
jgi:hypothetical protein